MMAIDIISSRRSTVFWKVVSAQALKWNSDGNKKATGVQARAPRIDRNLSSFYLRAIVNPITKATTKDRFRFLNHWRFLDLAQPSNR